MNRAAITTQSIERENGDSYWRLLLKIETRVRPRCIIELSCLKSYVYLALGGTGLDEQDIAIFDDIILSFCHDLARSLNSAFITVFLQSTVVVCDGLDESLFEVGVNNTSGSRCFNALANSPLTNLILTSGEEAAEVQRSAHFLDDRGESGQFLLLLQLIALGLFVLGGFVGLESQFLLKLSRDKLNRERQVSVGVFQPIVNTCEVLVLLALEVLLAQVDEIHNRLGGKEEQWVNDLNL